MQREWILEKKDIEYKNLFLKSGFKQSKIDGVLEKELKLYYKLIIINLPQYKKEYNIQLRKLTSKNGSVFMDLIDGCMVSKYNRKAIIDRLNTFSLIALQEYNKKVGNKNAELR